MYGVIWRKLHAGAALVVEVRFGLEILIDFDLERPSKVIFVH